MSQGSNPQRVASVPDDGRPPSARGFERALTAIVTVVGRGAPVVVASGAAVTLWGWLSGRTGWVVVNDTEAPVQFNTALGFLLVSVGLFVRARRPRGAATVTIAATVVLLGLATLCQYVFRTSFGIDELFVDHTVTTRTPSPGRMAPSTAFGFILAGTALVVKPSARVALGWAVMLLSALVLLDRLTGGTTHEITPFTVMAPQTQVLFALVALALVTAADPNDRGRDHRDDELESTPTTLRIAAACLLTLLLTSWQLLEREQWQDSHRDVGVALESLADTLEDRVRERGNALWRMADRWATYGPPERRPWEEEAERYLQDFPNINVMLIAEPDLTVRWQVSRDDSLPSLEGTTLGVDQGRAETFAAALAERRPRLMPFLELRVGGRGTAYTVPIMIDDRHVGYLNASIDAEDILDDVADRFFSGFRLALLDETGLQAGHLPDSDDLGRLLVREGSLDVFGQDWRLAVWPTDAQLQSRASYLPLFVLVSGLFAGAVSMALLSARRRHEEIRMRAQESTRVADERFHYVARAASDVIWDWDLVDDTVWWNDGLESVFGYRDDAVDARPEWRASRIHPDDRASVVTSLRQAIDGEADEWEAEYRFLDADDRPRHVVDRGFVIRDGSGRPIRMVGGVKDTTEQRESADRLVQAQKMEAVGQLTGGIAHDFNNLLTVILGSAELVQEASSEAEHLRALAEMIVTAAGRGAELTNRLLAFARRQPLEPSPTDVNELVSGMEALLRSTVEEHIDIRLVLADEPCVVEVDDAQLEAAVLNLVLNARDAMVGGGRLTIDVAIATLDDSYAEMDEEGKAGDYASISISDTGHGMSPDVVQRAFEPFFTTKPAGQGTGLGLSMVLGFIKQSGGHVTIYSEQGHGTTIRIYLPLIDDRPGAPEPLAVTPSAGDDEHILLVEDDELVRRHVHAVLLRLGYRVSEAASGAEALEILERAPDVDLLFTDVIMPGGMNGAQLAALATAARPDLKVLFTSGYTEDAIFHHGRLDEGVQLLGKPYSGQDLAAKLREVLAN